jgi:predicted helicase
MEAETTELRSTYSLPPDGRDWKIRWAQDDLIKGYRIEPVLYRPFDVRKTAYTGNSKGFLAYPRENTFRHFVDKDNIGLITVRQQSTFDFQHVLATKWMIESGAISLQTKEWGYIFPLYLYPKKGETLHVGEARNIPVARVPNIEILIARKIADIIGAVWYPVAEYPTKNGDLRLTPEEIFDYVYSVLYSPSYRQKYKELLKIDFPRVPYPKDRKQFDSLATLGKELRQIHLFESPVLNRLVTTYPIAGSNIVEKIIYKDDSVWINKEQYFGDVPEVAWNFYIGGYQPAQKWLKDRKGRALSNDDIEHWQKIIVALAETSRITKEIDKC